MPTYPYRCENGHETEIVKAMSEIDRAEVCEHCAAPAERYISRTHFYGAGDWNRPEFNPGLGCITKSWKHARQIAKSRGLEEVGTTSTDQIHHEAEAKQKSIREQHYADAARMK